MSAADWGRLLLLGALWGASFFLARIAVAEVAPLALVLLRVGIAALALQLFLAAAGPSFRLALPHLGTFVGLALLNNVIPFGLIFTGQTAVGAGLASALNATTPFWTLLVMSAFSADERLSANKLVGIGLGVAGAAVMVGPGLAANLGGPVWAKLALLGAALSYAFALLYARRFRGLPAPIIATGQLSLSTVMVAPVVLLAYEPAAVLPRSMEVWAAVLALAIFSTAFAYLLYFRLLATAGATNASLVTLVVPASAILLGVTFLGESLEPFEAAGMALIGLGLIMIAGRLPRFFVKKRSRR
ncbi:MAG TPA: DMT family transporter [Mesorhizobium sp.]|jgi:drug/metabolite transporter (DMT)-like permease|nr:DMT family transporter [Mesorhizobium sp.]